jgi:OmpA-OmpF porin, OOP family
VRGAAAVCAAIAAGGIACAGQRLRERVDDVVTVVQVARASGALDCAPVELAMAEAHTEFAVVELDEGDYYRARAELAIAETSAREALRLSPHSRCGESGPADRDRDGVPDDQDECMAQPEDLDGAEDQDGCPETDNDGDRLADSIDACPDKAEDQDGFSDDDGCPDMDNDGDQLADKIDQCPEKAEDQDGTDDDDGCPDCDDDGDRVPECPQALDRCPGQRGRPRDGCPYANVAVSENRIEVKRPIDFDPGKATVRAGSLALIGDVAQVLAEEPTLRIRVEVHTDNPGRGRTNLLLSRARAAEVKRLLVRRGIDPSRIVSKGYGESRPIAENRTPAGRAQNRRVEFLITGR